MWFIAFHWIGRSPSCFEYSERAHLCSDSMEPSFLREPEPLRDVAKNMADYGAEWTVQQGTWEDGNKSHLSHSWALFLFILLPRSGFSDIRVSCSLLAFVVIWGLGGVEPHLGSEDKLWILEVRVNGILRKWEALGLISSSLLLRSPSKKNLVLVSQGQGYKINMVAMLADLATPLTCGPSP